MEMLQTRIPWRLYVQVSFDKQILVVSVSPFQTFVSEAVGLFQLNVISVLRSEKKLEDAFLTINTSKKIATIQPTKSPFSMKDLLEKGTIECLPRTPEIKKEKEVRIPPDGFSLSKDLRVLIFSFLPENPFYNNIPFSWEWQLALDSYSFILPRFIFVRINITWMTNKKGWAILLGISRTPIVKTKQKSSVFNWHWNDDVKCLSSIEEERIEGYPLNKKEQLGLFNQNKLFGTRSLYDIQVCSDHLGDFSFHVIRKEKKGDAQHSLSLEDFLNLELETEMECNIRFEE